MQSSTRAAIVRRRRQGFMPHAIADEFNVPVQSVKNVLADAGIPPYAKRERGHDTRETKLRRRAIRELLDEGVERRSLVAAYGKSAVEEVERGIDLQGAVKSAAGISSHSQGRQESAFQEHVYDTRHVAANDA